MTHINIIFYVLLFIILVSFLILFLKTCWDNCEVKETETFNYGQFKPTDSSAGTLTTDSYLDLETVTVNNLTLENKQQFDIKPVTQFNFKTMNFTGDNFTAETKIDLGGNFDIRKIKSDFREKIRDYLFPIGSVFLSYEKDQSVTPDPNVTIGGIWEKMSENRYIFCIEPGGSYDQNNPTENGVGKIIEEDNYLYIDVENLPKHDHEVYYAGSETDTNPDTHRHYINGLSLRDWKIKYYNVYQKDNLATDSIDRMDIFSVPYMNYTHKLPETNLATAGKNDVFTAKYIPLSNIPNDYQKELDFTIGTTNKYIEDENEESESEEDVIDTTPYDDDEVPSEKEETSGEADEGEADEGETSGEADEGETSGEADEGEADEGEADDYITLSTTRTTDLNLFKEEHDSGVIDENGEEMKKLLYNSVDNNEDTTNKKLFDCSSHYHTFEASETEQTGLGKPFVPPRYHVICWIRTG